MIRSCGPLFSVHEPLSLLLSSFPPPSLFLFSFYQYPGGPRRKDDRRRRRYFIFCRSFLYFCPTRSPRWIVLAPSCSSFGGTPPSRQSDISFRSRSKLLFLAPFLTCPFLFHSLDFPLLLLPFSHPHLAKCNQRQSSAPPLDGRSTFVFRLLCLPTTPLRLCGQRQTFSPWPSGAQCPLALARAMCLSPRPFSPAASWRTPPFFFP